MTSILLLGGGTTLQALAQLLPESSFVITSRNQSSCEEFQANGWRSAVCDTASLDSLKALLQEEFSESGLDIIVDSIPPFRSEIPLQGVENTIAALKDLRLNPRVLYLSTSSVFGVTDGGVVDGNTSSAPSNPASEARWNSEGAYRRAGFETTAVRIPAIYGPGRGLRKALSSGNYSLIGEGENWTNRVHLEDLARFLHGFIEHVNELPNVIAVSDDKPSKASEVVDYYMERFSLPRPSSISLEEARARNTHSSRANLRIDNTLAKKFAGISELLYPSYREGSRTE